MPGQDAPGQAEPAPPRPEGLGRGDAADLLRMDKAPLPADQASKDAVAGALGRYAEMAAKVSPEPDMFGSPPASAGQVLKDALANPSRHDAVAEFCQDAADDAEFYAAHGMAGDPDSADDAVL